MSWLSQFVHFLSCKRVLLVCGMYVKFVSSDIRGELFFKIFSYLVDKMLSTGQQATVFSSFLPQIIFCGQ